MKVKPFVKTSTIHRFQLLTTPKRRKRKAKMHPTRKGKSIAQPRLGKKKKSSPHTVETQSLGCNKCPGKPSPQPPRIFSDSAPSFLPCPGRGGGGTALLANRIPASRGGGPRGKLCPAPPAATHPSRGARATAAAGWLRAGIREGWRRAPAPQVADMWLEPALSPSAVASEHLSGGAPPSEC